jgi:Uma2 family endonuclease
MLPGSLAEIGARRKARIRLTALTAPRAVDTIPTMAGYETRTRRFSRVEYERLIDLGVFRPGEAIELIGGELIVAEPQGAAHYTAIVKTARTLEAAFGPGWHARMQGPVGLDADSEPEPDVAVVAGGPDDYGRAHPSRPALTVEVADSSLAADRQHKGSLYARAGLADYWVLNLPGRVLEVYRDPTPDSAAPFGWRYARVEVFDASAHVAPLAAPGSRVLVSRLLP